jgi:hypothetical protein
MSSLHNVYGKNLANARDEKVTPAVQYVIIFHAFANWTMYQEYMHVLYCTLSILLY